MKSFAKEFLREDLGPERQIFLGAFGKHPGWDDHIDDIGLETESMVCAKQMLYVEGVGGQIGPWEQLEWPAQIAFNHVFLWRRGEQLLVGRLWTSSDGKKRTRYPMVLCAHCSKMNREVVLETLLAWLEELRTRAMATRSADEVREMVGQFRDGLRAWINELDGAAPPPFENGEFLSDLGVDAGDVTLTKSLWRICCNPYSLSKHRGRADGSAEKIRVLASSASAARSLHFWSRLLDSQLDPGAPLLLLLPMDQYWLDAVVGELASRDLFCLRASPRALPLSSDEEAEVPTRFLDEARALIEQAASGKPMEAGAREGSWMTRFLGK